MTSKNGGSDLFTGHAHDDSSSDRAARERLSVNLDRKKLSPVNADEQALTIRYAKLGKSRSRRGNRSPEEIRREIVLKNAVVILKQNKARDEKTAIKQQDLADMLGIPRRGAGNYLAFGVAWGMLRSLRRASDASRAGTDAIYYYLPKGHAHE